MRTVLSLLVLIFVPAFGGYMIWNGLYDAREARLSVEWPSVEGKILSHSVERHWHRRERETFEPIVWYEYHVEGAAYKDSRISWYAERFTSEHAAIEYLKRHFPIGGSVRVHYDPNHPHHACLVTGGVSHAMVPVYAAVTMLVVFAVIQFVVLLRRRASSC